MEKTQRTVTLYSPQEEIILKIADDSCDRDFSRALRMIVDLGLKQYEVNDE